MNYTSTHIVSAKNIPTLGVYLRNIFISIFSVLLLSFCGVAVKGQTVTFSPAGPFCVGTSITVNITGGSNNQNWVTQIVNGNTGAATVLQSLGTININGTGNGSLITPLTVASVGSGLYIKITNGGTSVYSSISFTVYATSVGGVVNSSATVCSGNNSGTLNLSGQTGNVIRWESSTNGGTTWTSISNTTTSLIYTNVSTTTQYRAVVQNGVCATANSSAATISMPSALTASFTPTTSITACPNYNPGILTSTVSGGLSSYTYNWQQGTSTTGPWTTVGTAANYTSPNLTSAGTYVYQLVVTDACGTSVTTAQKIITIVPEATITVTQPSAVCLGASLTLNSSVSNGTGTYTYKWQSSSSSGGPWTDITGFTTTSTYSPSTTAAGTTYYQVIVSPSGAACNNATSNAVSVVVNATPTTYSVAGGGSYCSGGTGVAVGLSGSQTGVNYQLQLGGVNTGSPVAGTGSAISFGNQTTAGTYTVVATNATTLCTSNMSGSVSVTITPSSITNNDIAVVSSTCSVILQGTTPTTSCCSFTYQWYTSVDNSSPASFFAVPGATGKDYTPASGSQNNWFYRMVICADGTKSQSTSTVHAHAPMSAIASAQINASCYGGTNGSITFSVSNGNPKYNYTWATSSGTILASNSNIATDFNVTFNNLSAGNYVFTVTDQDNPTPCTQVRNITITQPAASLSVNTPAASYCSGSTYTISASASGGTPNYSYQWQNNGSNISGATSSSYNATGAGTYSVVVTDANACTAMSSGNVTVSAVPTVSNSSLSQTICSGNTTTAVTLTSNVSGTSFSWATNATAGVSGFTPSGTNTIPAQTISTTGTTAGTVTYTITPTGPSPTNCPGTVATYTITVNPTPVVTTAATASTCSGTSPNISLLASVASTYSWTIGTITGGITGATASSGTTINQVLTNPSNTTAGTVQYIVTPTSGSCAGAPYAITVTVNPKPVVTNASTATTCSGGSPNIGLTASVASTYSWTVGTITGGITGASAGSGSTINQTLTNASTSVSGSVQYIVTPTATTGSCPGTPYTITVTVNPSPVITSAATKIICSGSPTNISLTASAASTFTWTIGTITGSITGASAGSGSTINQILTNPGTSAAGTVEYNIIPTATTGSCTGAPYTITVTVNPGPAITITPAAPTICSGTGTTLTASSTVSGTTYSWTSTPAGFTSTSAAITVAPSSTTTYNVTGTANGCQGTQSATVTVNTVTAGSVGTDQTLCNGGSPNPFTVITNATGAGTISYQWQISTTSSTTGFSDISGATSATFSPSAVSQNTWYQRITTSSVNGVSCSATGNVIFVSLYPVTAGTIGSDQTICSGFAPAPFTNQLLATVPNGASGPTYQWQYSINGTTWIDIPTATAATYTSGTLTQTTQFRRAARGSKVNQFDCTVYSNVITVTVNPLPTISGTLAVCVGNTTQLTGSATAASSNPWVSSNTAIATVSNAGLVTGVAQGTATITYTNSNSCQITATIIVNPLPSPTITHN